MNYGLAHINLPYTFLNNIQIQIQIHILESVEAECEEIKYESYPGNTCV